MKLVKSLRILLIGLTVMFFGCANANDSEMNRRQIKNTQISSTPSKLTLDSSIRQIDFKNFTFPSSDEDLGRESFTLQDGKKEMTNKDDGANLQRIEYGDVTNNGTEEAFLNILPITGGNCQCEMVYIYSLENKKPKLLWSFDTWDRAMGGFKKAYEKGGDLIIELFGSNKFENDVWNFGTPEGKFKGLCCPTAYNKFRFRWNGSKFVLKEKPELLDYDGKKE